ncbi:hypothetical protein [Streptomyces sp. NPDC002671]
MASLYAPASRYHGLSPNAQDLLATVTNTTIDAVQAAHKADLADWAREQQLRDHPPGHGRPRRRPRPHQALPLTWN